MALYETIFKRRQVRKFYMTPLKVQTLDNILKCIEEARQFSGQNAKFEIVSAEDVTGGQPAPHYLLSYSDDNSIAYANVGYLLQKADLYIQSIGLGSGWFMGVREKNAKENQCIGLAFGNTDMPLRKGVHEFNRRPLSEISQVDNPVAEAVRLAPSFMNSQPWKLEFGVDKVIVKDSGSDMILRNKLNKIDIGIAARHAVLALEQEGKTVFGIMPVTDGNEFKLEISYR